jgi:hypothetical protein
MSLKRLNNTSSGMSYHGLSNPSKVLGIVADTLAGVHNMLMKCTTLWRVSEHIKAFTCLMAKYGPTEELPTIPAQTFCCWCLDWNMTLWLSSVHWSSLWKFMMLSLPKPTSSEKNIDARKRGSSHYWTNPLAQSFLCWSSLSQSFYLGGTLEIIFKPQN